MTELAGVDDLEARLGRTLSGTEPDRASTLLADASARVVGYTGQTFALETTTDLLKVRNGRITLPQRPVVEVTAVADMNDVTVEFTVTNDILWLNPTVPDPWQWEPRRTPLGYVNVTYSHGYELVPDDIVGVTCSIVLRAFGVDATDTGVMQEAIAGYSYQLGSAASAGGFGLLPDERQVLDLYRRVGGMATFA